MVTLADIDAYEAGGDVVDYAAKVANVARNAACALYSNYPKSIVPNPIDSLVRGVWDGFCANSPTPLPAPPAPPFNGGQCTFGYDFVLTATDTATNTVVDSRFFTNRPGALTGFRRTEINPTLVLWEFGYNNGTEYLNLGSAAPTVVWEVESLSPTGGGSDSCGDPPADWPNQTTIPPGGNETTEPITLEDGSTTNVNVTVNIPLGGINFTPDVNINIQPNISILGEINVKFDLGGLHISPPGDASDLSDRIDDIKRNTDPTPKPTDPGVDQTDKPPEENTEDNDDNLLYVVVNLTTLPTQNKIQFGQGEAPDVVYAGWFSFTIDGHPLLREPICYDGQIFYNSKNANGYCYTLTNGAEGFVSKYTRSE